LIPVIPARWSRLMAMFLKVPVAAFRHARSSEQGKFRVSYLPDAVARMF
jgi:hypothetical protein